MLGDHCKPPCWYALCLASENVWSRYLGVVLGAGQVRTGLNLIPIVMSLKPHKVTDAVLELIGKSLNKRMPRRIR